MKSTNTIIIIIIILITIIKITNSIPISLYQEIEERCPCLESNLCYVSSRSTFDVFQRTAPRCSGGQVRCCSNRIMVKTLLELQSRRNLKKPVINNKKTIENRRSYNKDLKCRNAHECHEAYGSKSYHVVFGRQSSCSWGQVRCVVAKATSYLPCVSSKMCREAFGTKPQHYLTFGIMPSCSAKDQVRCISVEITTTTTTTSRPAYHYPSPAALLNEDTSGGQIIINQNDPLKPPSVQIIGPKPVFLQAANMRGPVNNNLSERQQLTALLKQTINRLQSYLGRTN